MWASTFTRFPIILHPTDPPGVLKELFGQIGKVRKAFIHLGPTGKSTGVADVIFDNNRDADRALTTYNNIELDRTFPLPFLLRMSTLLFPPLIFEFYMIDRPMRIAYATNPAVLTALAQQPRSQHRNAAPRGNNARGGRGGRGRGGGRRSEGQPKKSQEELDAEMDSYMQAPPVCIVKSLDSVKKKCMLINFSIFSRRTQPWSLKAFISF